MFTYELLGTEHHHIVSLRTHLCLNLFFLCLIRNTASCFGSAGQRIDNKYLLNEMNFYNQILQYTLSGVCCMTFTEANCPYWAKSLFRKLSFVSINWSQYWPHHTANPLMRDTCFLLQRNSLIYIIENCLFHCVFPF